MSLRKFQKTDSKIREVLVRILYPELDEDKGKIEAVSVVHKKPNTDFN